MRMCGILRHLRRRGWVDGQVSPEVERLSLTARIRGYGVRVLRSLNPFLKLGKQADSTEA